MFLTKRCKYSFDLLSVYMESWEILGLAARHYTILKCLNKKNFDYSELGKATNDTPRSTLGKYIKEMSKVGLLEEKKEGRKTIILILKQGKITLDYIDKYELLILEPILEDELQKSLDQILAYHEKNYEIKELEEIHSKKLIELCNKNPESIFYQSLQNFFEDYLNKQKFSNDINGVIQRHIRYIMHNLKLRAWFYERIFPILVNQVNTSGINYMVRNTRVVFLWEIFRSDNDKKDEILNIFLEILENECKSQDGEICKFICSSYPSEVKEEISTMLLKLYVNKEILKRFFSST